jgi:hypothetical protein
MTPKETQDYQPSPNSAPSLLIGFFTNHPSEFLTLEDVAEKFGRKIINLRKTLQPAVDAGLLTCQRDDLDNYIYRGAAARPDVLAATDVTTTSQGAEVRRTTAAPVEAGATPKVAKLAALRKMFDIDALTVDEGVPYLASQTKGKSKWDPLFARLTHKGQSIQIPGDCLGAINAAACKKNDKKQGTFKVGAVAGGFARVWRTS